MIRLLVTCSLLSLAACTQEPSTEQADLSPEGESLVGSRSDGIIGGITDNRRTYVVGIGDNSSAFCSGTLISKRTVITAGHCYGSIKNVFTGTDLKGQKLAVKRSVRHPGYSSSTMTNDLTIVELAADAPMQPAPLLRENMNDDLAAFVGPDMTFGGYGYSNGQTGSGFGTRRVVVFPITAMGPATLPSGGTVRSIDATMFYYRLNGKNTCNGDSGGPTFINRGGVERHAGVTSYGDRSCVLDGAQNRTDLPAINGFIQQWINTFEGEANKCKNDGVCDESCNTGDQLVDPDCAQNHCGQDGICALSCVQPIDPDCGAANVCGSDGACDTSCASDPDCTSGPTPPTGPTGPTGPTPPTGPTTSVVEATDTPVQVQDNATVASKLTVATAGGAGTVEYDIKHTWRGDLEVSLVDPAGNVTVVFARNDPNNGDDDVTGTAHLDSVAAGTYELRVRDFATDDTGSIVRFAIRF